MEKTWVFMVLCEGILKAFYVGMCEYSLCVIVAFLERLEIKGGRGHYIMLIQFNEESNVIFSQHGKYPRKLFP
jgi:hypothetical protein